MMKRSMKKIVRYSVAIATALLFVGTCLAQESTVNSPQNAQPKNLSRGTFSFNPTDDSYIGAYGEINGNLYYMGLRNGSSGNQWLASPVVKFDISSVPSNASSQIISAKVYLYYFEYITNNPAGRSLTMRRFLTNWNEETISRNNWPPYSSDVSAVASTPASPGFWVSWDVKNDVQKFVSGSLVNYGWIINDEQYWSGYNIPGSHFYAKEEGSFIPYLEIIVNDPPAAPQITGQASGKHGQSYDYTFISSDPNGDQIYFTIEWGDGQTNTWIGPYNSGQPLTLPHSWAKTGTYTIKAKAKDTYGAESGWGTLQITMPLSNNLVRPHFLEQLFERFPHLFPLLRHWLGY